MFTNVLRRLRYHVNRRREQKFLEEEMRLHCELRQQRLAEEGVDDAERSARVHFGNPTFLQEQSASVWQWTWMANLGKDLRYAFRSLRRSPVFTIVAFLLLALGIGANTAIFSVANVLLLRMLPVRDASKVFYLHVLPGQPDGASSTGNPTSSFSFHVFSELRNQRNIFSSLIAYVPAGYNKISVRTGKLPQEASVDMVSGNFFTGLGVPLLCGGGFTSNDERLGSAVAVVGNGFWAGRLGASCDVLGSKIYIKGIPFTVVGVAPSRFPGVATIPTDVWIPLQQRAGFNAWGSPRNDYRKQDRWWCLRMIGRVQSGLNEQKAEAALQPLFRRFAYDRLDGKPRADETPRTLDLVAARGALESNSGFQQSLYILLAMVGLILLIACANVAMLLVARNSARTHEFSIRLAVGGSKARFFQQLLAESLLLVAGGALLGWLFGLGATRVLARWAGLETNLAPDANVLLFTVSLSLVVALAFGLAPLSTAWRGATASFLRQSASTAFQGHRAALARRTVLVLQIAIGIVLSVSAVLLVRTLQNLQSKDLGFQPERLLAFGIQPPLQQETAQGDAPPSTFYETVLDKLRGLPGVEGATLVNNRPGTSWINGFGITVDGQDPRSSAHAASNMLWWNGVGGSYCKTLGIALISGRDITDADSASAPRVAIVNETFEKSFLQGRSALGHQVNFTPSMAFMIVGVTRDSQYGEVREEPKPMAYVPYRQIPDLTVGSMIVRGRGEPMQLQPEIRRALASLAPNSALLQPMTEAQQFAETISGERLMARLALFFGLLALVLVATGLYGTLSYAVSRRTAELGIRMAIGAQRRSVLWMVVRENLYVCLIGLLLGLPLAFYATRLLASQLYGLTAHDPSTFACVSLLMLAIAAIASLLPAYRAATIDPMRALRWE